MNTRFRGRVWKFGDHVNTDVITPGKYENLPMEELCRHCLEPLDSSFARSVSINDVLVAGENFGCGSAREIAPRALKVLGIGAVVAKSFSRTFFRNAVAIGLPVILSREAADRCNPGDVLRVNLARSSLRNLTAKGDLLAEPIPKEMVRILIHGGLFAAHRRDLHPKAGRPKRRIPSSKSFRHEDAGRRGAKR